MSADKRDERRDRDDEGISEEAGAIEGWGLRSDEEDAPPAPQDQETDPPEELEEERRG